MERRRLNSTKYRQFDSYLAVVQLHMRWSTVPPKRWSTVCAIQRPMSTQKRNRWKLKTPWAKQGGTGGMGSGRKETLQILESTLDSVRSEIPNRRKIL